MKVTSDALVMKALAGWALCLHVAVHAQGPIVLDQRPPMGRLDQGRDTPPLLPDEVTATSLQISLPSRLDRRFGSGPHEQAMGAESAMADGIESAGGEGAALELPYGLRGFEIAKVGEGDSQSRASDPCRG